MIKIEIDFEIHIDLKIKRLKYSFVERPPKNKVWIKASTMACSLILRETLFKYHRNLRQNIIETIEAKFH